MRHEQLQNSGRSPHRTIDQQLPSIAQKLTLEKLLLEQKLEIIAAGNTGFDQDDNWRFIIDGSGNLDLEKRVGGSWTNKDTWT